MIIDRSRAALYYLRRKSLFRSRVNSFRVYLSRKKVHEINKKRNLVFIKVLNDLFKINTSPLRKKEKLAQLKFQQEIIIKSDKGLASKTWLLEEVEYLVGGYLTN